VQPLNGSVADFFEPRIERDDVLVGITDRLFTGPIAFRPERGAAHSHGSDGGGCTFQKAPAIERA
jgi:hypothetical protein